MTGISHRHSKIQRPDSAFTIGRPISAVHRGQGKRNFSPGNYNKRINSMRLDDILAIYEAKCADNDVE